VWDQLHKKVYYRLRVNVKARSKSRGISKIYVLEEDSLLADAYAVARKIFQSGLLDRM